MRETDCEIAITSRVEVYIEKVLQWFVELTRKEEFLFIQSSFFCRYSTFLVKYSWCFLLLGAVICISMGVSAVLLRDLPNFSDPTKVNKHRFSP